MAYYAADNFGGSGVIPGSNPQQKDAAVGAWALSPSGGDGGDSGIWTRSAGGAIYTDDTAGGGGAFGTYLRALGTVSFGAGLANFEASGKGAFRLVLVFTGGGESDVISISVEEDGSVNTSCEFGSNSNSNSSSISPVGLTTTTVLRIEFSTTAVRTYANNALVMNAGFGATGSIVRASTYHGFAGTSPSGNTALTNFSGAAKVLLNYVNFQLGVSTGPLGSPGGPSVAITLPKLVVAGGQFRRGNAALALPHMYTSGALPPVPPSFWAGLVGAREVP